MGVAGKAGGMSRRAPRHFTRDEVWSSERKSPRAKAPRPSACILSANMTSRHKEAHV